MYPQYEIKLIFVSIKLMCSAASLFSGIAIAVRLTWYPWLHSFAGFTLRHIFGKMTGKYKLDLVLRKNYNIIHHELNNSDSIAPRMNCIIPADIRYFTVGGGVLLSCLAISCAGSPRTILLSNAIMLLGWAILALLSGKNAYFFLVSYVILELGTICSMNSNIVYITEIIDPGLRGCFGAFSLAVYSLGLIIAQSITIVEFRANPMTATMIGILFCCLGLLFSFNIPESPIRLLLNGKDQRASTVFSWLHNGTPKDKVEYLDLVKMAQKHNERRGQSFNYVAVTIFSRQFLKPLILVSLFCTVYIGVLFEPVISYFAYKTFDHYWHHETERADDPKAFAITLFAYGMRLVISILVSVLIPRLKRRTIFLVSAFSSAYGLMLLIVAEQFSLTAAATTVIFVSYVVFTCFGVLSFPFIVMAEVSGSPPSPPFLLV